MYNQIAPQLDINPDYSISQYRDSRKREIDFVVESTGEHTLPFGKSLYAIPMGTLCT